MVHINLEDVFEDVAEDIEKRFDTWNLEANRPLSIGQNKIVIKLMKDELGGKVKKEIVALRPKMYSISRMMIMLTRNKIRPEIKSED